MSEIKLRTKAPLELEGEDFARELWRLSNLSQDTCDEIAHDLRIAHQLVARLPEINAALRFKAEVELALREWLQCYRAPRKLWNESWEHNAQEALADTTQLFFPVVDRGHKFPGVEAARRGEEFFTSNCIYGCGCWMGGSRSGTPNGVSLYGDCPKYPEDKALASLDAEQQPEQGGEAGT